MEMTYDKEVDTAYISLAGDITEGEVKKTIELNENIIIDFDSDGKMIGVEVLNASKVLNSKVLADSAR